MSKSIASRTIIRLAAICIVALSSAAVATAQAEQPLATEIKQKHLSALTVVLSLFFLSLSVTAVAQRKPNAPPPYAAPGRLVDVGGYRLHLNCTGNISPTVVLIAGAGDFSFDWGLVQPLVASFARVCSYDRAGFAWSDPGPTPHTMRQEAYELHALLRAAGIKGPYVLVGHSIGGLIARVYAEHHPTEISGMVLVDATHEDTTLMYQGKLFRVRDGAKGRPVPAPQTMQSSPPKPPTKEDIKQFQFNQQTFGAPKIEPPFDKLPPSTQAMRLWFLSQPPRAAGGDDLWAEELQLMYAGRGKTPYQLDNMPLVVLLPNLEYGNPPPGISIDEWKRVNDEKRQQKIGFTDLSRNSKLIVAGKSGHHLQLDEPQIVTDAIRLVVGAVRRRTRLAP
jgi:pimeloyl-ACP methyl ester carboxylesterase